jgi:short-subunit dehydrogenase
MNKIIITGVSKGLGLSLANFFLDKRYKVYGISRNTSSIKHDNYHDLKCDLKNIKDVEYLCDQLDDNIDILINNAGVHYNNSFENIDENIWNNIIDTNLKAPFFLTKYILHKQKKDILIIFINSISAKKNKAHEQIYASSKSGLAVLADSIFYEKRNYNVKVTTIYSGYINTNFVDKDNRIENGINPDELAEVIYSISKMPNNIVVNDITIRPQYFH